MSWVSSLCALYDANQSRAGEMESWTRGSRTYPLVLLPIGHSTALAQIEITLDEDGSFLDARALEKSEALTLIPVTEASASRTSAPEAMPLFDKLIYVAGDYKRHINMKIDKAETCHLLYLSGLKAWCNSEFSHPRVKAILNYVSKARMIGDLVSKKIILLDEKGMFAEKTKIAGIQQNDAFVRFRVFGGAASTKEILNDPDGTHGSAVWLDKSVQRSFAQYYKSLAGEPGLCYMSGERMATVALHPKKIRNDADGTKLISANDDTNFTYRGRFQTKDEKTGKNEAVSVGFETSQKAHNALKWIIRRQGYTRGGICMVTWEEDLREVPEFYRNAPGIIGISKETDESEDGIDALLPTETEAPPDTDYVSAKEFNAAIDGYRLKLGDSSKMVVLALDNATTGRLAMTYFKELSSSRYLENIRIWHESCCWQHGFFIDKKYQVYEGMASIEEISKAVYGVEQNKILTLRKSGDKCPLLSAGFERLRPCILEGSAIPRDMVRTAVIKASNPMAYEKWYNYEIVLSVACSLVKRLYWEKLRRNEKEGEIIDMKLDLENTNRSYLYGRLLAVAEVAERSTYDREETRATNAERYMQTFSVQPFRTFNIIRRNLIPYMNSMKPISKNFYNNLFMEINDKFADEDFKSNKPLDGRYISGYYCQRAELKYKKKETEVTSENENGGN
ncbi:MAG: type I-C CRISPR-associated protein Cas8c/Csd1 [Clostridia bacterium]